MRWSTRSGLSSGGILWNNDASTRQLIRERLARSSDTEELVDRQIAEGRAGNLNVYDSLIDRIHGIARFGPALGLAAESAALVDRVRVLATTAPMFRDLASGPQVMSDVAALAARLLVMRDPSR